MKKLIFIVLIVCSSQLLAKPKVDFYTNKQIINIEIALCDQLPKNKIYRCLMLIGE